jgi:hypothetical protein
MIIIPSTIAACGFALAECNRMPWIVHSEREAASGRQNLFPIFAKVPGKEKCVAFFSRLHFSSQARYRRIGHASMTMAEIAQNLFKTTRAKHAERSRVPLRGP